MKSDLVDIDAVELRRETEKAYGLSQGELDENDREILAWVPKSKVEKNDDGTFTMPEWLAMEKGLI